MTLRIAVLISGRGSNLAAVVHAIARGACDASVACVISDRASAQGLVFAEEHGLPTALCSMGDHASRDAWNEALAAKVASYRPELVVLAGFMRVLGAPLIERFARRVINVHPSLLPLFPGTASTEQAIAAGMRISGCTVHIVDSGVDTGPIIAQAALRVLPNDTPDTLHARIQSAEHRLLPAVIHAIARGSITLDPDVRMHAATDDSSILSSPLFVEPSS